MSKNISGGFISELSYIYLALGLMETSRDIESKSLELDEIVRRKADYRVDKKIVRRMEKLEAELIEFVKKYQSVHAKGRAKREMLLRNTLIGATSAIQLDYLAMMILSLRFQPHERVMPLHDDFKWLTKKNNSLYEIIDLLGETGCSNKESEMYILAEKIVRDL